MASGGLTPSDPPTGKNGIPPPMPYTIFYSWQADLPNSTNRGFIQAALDEAARSIAADLNIQPVIERDTLNIPGSPDIAITIFRKISTSQAFVADITLINPKEAERRTPNPNVLLELGYALHALGQDRIILIMNRAYGPPEALPFDLKMRRVITYDMGEGTERGPERRRLAGILSDALKAAISATPQEEPLGEVDAAIDAVETRAPNKTALTRRAMTAITKELEALAPPLFRDGATVEQLLEALESSIPAVQSYTRLANTAAIMDDAETARELYKTLLTIFEHFENPRGWEGTFDSRDFDYWKFLGNELLITIIAALLHEERYETITDLIEEPFTLANTRLDSGTLLDFTHANQWLRSLEPLQEETLKLSYHGHLLQKRHEVSLSEDLPLNRFAAADYLLFLRGELAPGQQKARGTPWAPWTGPYLRVAPAFINSAARAKTAARLARTLGLPDVATLKNRLRERAGKLPQLFGGGMYLHSPVSEEQIQRIGTR